MMQRRRIRTTPARGEITTHTEYPHRLNFYTVPPSGQLAIDEFEQWAVDRMRILSKIDAMMLENSARKDWDKELRPLLMKHLPLAPTSKGKSGDLERRKDHYSHFILRMCFCRTKEMQHRFESTETHLFRYRFKSASEAEQREFIESLPLDLHELGPSELHHVPKGFRSDRMFRVNWTKVTDLVSDRRCYLRDGYAYITSEQIVSLVVSEFSSHLHTALKLMTRTIGRLDESDRLEPIMDHIAQGFQWSLDTHDVAGDGSLTAADLIQADRNNDIPLCMSMMARTAGQKRHAKYHTRSTLSVFLKHTGLSVDHAHAYWRLLFGKEVDKELVYQTKHSYGVAGGRIAYAPPSCVELARKKDYSEDDPCGCPFKKLDADKLEVQLKMRGVTSPADLNYIKTQNKQMNFHFSCTRFYEATHPNDKNAGSITAPNGFFERARAASSQNASQSASMTASPTK